MTSTEVPPPTLIRLGDTGQTVANPAEDVRGRKVTGTDSETLGKIHDLLVDDQHGKVRFLVVEHGGLLGIGADESYVPVEAITEITADEVIVDIDRERIVGAPRYDPDLGDKRGYFETVYGYYGFPSMWGVGGIEPPHYPYVTPRGRQG